MKRSAHVLKLVVALIALVNLSCKDNFAQLKTISQFDALPIGEADTIRVVYTEFAKTIAVLTAPKNIDYTNQPFPYSEFPNGVQVVLYDENNKETHVMADYGVIYSRTDIVDLRGNVFITTPEGAVLNTSQLYWDIKKEWVFTQEYFTFKNEDYDIAANILDASRSFDKITTGPLVGNVLVEEEEL
jgi:LPS export ABC transporter protein LptC